MQDTDHLAGRREVHPEGAAAGCEAHQKGDIQVDTIREQGRNVPPCGGRRDGPAQRAPAAKQER